MWPTRGVGRPFMWASAGLGRKVSVPRDLSATDVTITGDSATLGRIITVKERLRGGPIVPRRRLHLTATDVTGSGDQSALSAIRGLRTIDVTYSSDTAVQRAIRGLSAVDSTRTAAAGDVRVNDDLTVLRMLDAELFDCMYPELVGV